MSPVRAGARPSCGKNHGGLPRRLVPRIRSREKEWRGKKRMAVTMDCLAGSKCIWQ
jgi:hypothetical protein